MNLNDTIIAIATPPGRGGIGIVRLAGPDARSLALPMLRLKCELEPGRAVFGELIEPSGGEPDKGDSSDSPARAHFGEAIRTQSAEGRTESSPRDRIDEVVVTFFQKPHSYTTDDIVEISAHGSPVVLRHILQLALARGARLAEPGEFTMRAFLNGRLDLTQAEAVRDLIDSQTLFQAKVAAQQLDGALSKRIKPIKRKLIELIAVLEAGIDFAEDDISVARDPVILQHIADVRGPLEQLAASFTYGKIVHEGLTLAIVGRPNVGKSSLFNRLVERERAIVTAQPGTTRDPVSETIAIAGIPLQLLDTAGIRPALDEAESIGIQKSMEVLSAADLVLVVLDVMHPVSEQDRELLRQVEDRPAVLVENKCDLRSSQFLTPDSRLAKVETSALTGEGVPELRAAILRHVGGEIGPQIETGFLTNLRHEKLVRDSIGALGAASDAVSARVPHEMLLLDLYGALRPLDEITGATTTDDILNLIFSTFCIGK